MAKSDAAVDAVMNALQSKNVKAVYCAASDLPDILIADIHFGFIPVFIALSENLTLTDSIRQELKKKVANLRQDFPELLGKLQPPLLVNVTASTDNQDFKVNDDWIRNLTKIEDVDFDLLKLIARYYDSSYMFARKKRVIESDDHRADRELQRIRLDEQQREIVDLPYGDLLWVRGPAGSGKTLVLIARAMKMAKEHPDWKIHIVAFNRSLMAYFRSGFQERSNVIVETFGDFTRNRGATFRFYRKVGNEHVSITEFEANSNLAAAREHGIPKDVDAIFIDEAQDFFHPWLSYCFESVNMNRGGVTLAGDLNQALYRDSKLEEAIGPYGQRIVEFSKPYRSTKQIHRLVDILLDEQSNLNLDSVPSGPNPEVTFVNSAKRRKDALLEAVVFDLVILLRDGGVSPGDIAILATANHYRYGLAEEIEKRLKDVFYYDIKVDSIEKHAADKLDISRDTIKLTTIYNAKGLEFPVVLLLGLEDIDKYLDEENEKERKRHLRLNLVGPSRAKDRLLIYFTRENRFLERLRHHMEGVNFRTYPEDYGQE